MNRDVPMYVERIARLPQVFELLLAHPGGLPLRDLAAHLQVPAPQLREDLLAFYAADVDSELLLGLTRPGVLEFLGPDGDEADPADAEIVRVADPRNVDELGVEHVDAAEFALIDTAARALLEIEPDNADLRSAVDALAETMLGPGAGSAPAAADEDPTRPSGAVADPDAVHLETLSHGQQQRRRVGIVYSRAWEAGVTERVIEPYRLVRTGRGWEVDAGPLDLDGRPRTFLVSNMREAVLREEGFDPPPHLDRLLAEQRATRTVHVDLPQSARWAADVHAESVRVVDDGELVVRLELDLLPPVRRRLGLLLLAAGPDAGVKEAPDLADAGTELARDLLAHHSQPPAP